MSLRHGISRSITLGRMHLTDRRVCLDGPDMHCSGAPNVECLVACAIDRSGRVLQLNTDRPEDLFSLLEVQTRAQGEQQLLDPALPQQPNAPVLVHFRLENTSDIVIGRNGCPFPVRAQLLDSPLDVGVAAASPKLAPELQLAFVRVEIEVET
jgi:hypothetical protein